MRQMVDEDEDEAPATVSLALELLHAIAEDAGLRPSRRIAARRHFRRLARMAAEERRPVEG